MTPLLWHLEISHYNEKARWALDYKGVAHVRRAVTPGLQELTARRLRAGRTVPILEMNGRAIGDSTKIIEAIERRWPEPPLYPADPEERAARSTSRTTSTSSAVTTRGGCCSTTTWRSRRRSSRCSSVPTAATPPLETLTPLFAES